MRRVLCVSLALGVSGSAVAAFTACSSSSGSGFDVDGGGLAGKDGDIVFNPKADGATTTADGRTITNPQMDAGPLMMTAQPDTGVPNDGMVITTTTTTIYAHTDTELYSIDPKTHALTDIGTFKGTSGGYYDSTITDLAVDAAGDIYVNTETVVYKVTLPATPGAGAAVNLTSFVNTSPGLKDGGEPAVKFYALAFAPAGAIGVATLPTGETLVGGDSKGEIWVIQANGTPLDVGNFGEDPDMPTTNTLALSGDLVFYDDATGTATGLATIRSCTTSDLTKCIKTSDHLAAINMANLKANATTPTSSPASLLGGIYGGTATTDGPGTQKAELFGLGAWEGEVYGFARCYECYDGGVNTPASIVKINTSAGDAGAAGAAEQIAGNFPFVNGWSGAGVTTKVTVTVIAPPPTAPPPMAH